MSGATTALPPAMREVDIDENLGARLNSNLAFIDMTGKRVVLGDYFGGDRPVVLTLAYYRCPMLCGLVLRGLVNGLRQLDFAIGKDYRALTVSIDAEDKPAEAARKQSATLAALGRPHDPGQWSFLIGERDNIASLADAIGFRFAADDRTGQYAHPAVVVVLTPDGRVSRYLYGTEFPARDLRLALVEAGSGKVGTIVDRVLLTCYRFDPATRRFGPFIRGFMRIGALFILGAVVVMLAVLFRVERRRNAGGEAP